MNRMIFIGRVGSDAGGWFIGADGKIHPVPGWAPEQFADLSHAVSALRHVSRIKNPEFTRQLASTLHGLLSQELAGHIKEGDVIVFESGDPIPA